mgnify:CR=1 FL=1
MGTKRKPTQVLEATGAFRRNPNRRRGAEPQVSDSLGAPPPHLSPTEIQAWQEFAAQTAPGVLSASDRHLVEQASRLVAESRENYAQFSASKIGLLNKLLNQMGLTPVGRASLSVPPQKSETNPFAHF